MIYTLREKSNQTFQTQVKSTLEQVLEVVIKRMKRELPVLPLTSQVLSVTSCYLSTRGDVNLCSVKLRGGD